MTPSVNFDSTQLKALIISFRKQYKAYRCFQAELPYDTNSAISVVLQLVLKHAFGLASNKEILIIILRLQAACHGSILFSQPLVVFCSYRWSVSRTWTLIREQVNKILPSN